MAYNSQVSIADVLFVSCLGLRWRTDDPLPVKGKGDFILKKHIAVIARILYPNSASSCSSKSNLLWLRSYASRIFNPWLGWKAFTWISLAYEYHCILASVESQFTNLPMWLHIVITHTERNSGEPLKNILKGSSTYLLALPFESTQRSKSRI